MADIRLTYACQACNGTGIRWYNSGPNGPLVSEDPCSMCGGDGRRTSTLGLDDALVQGIIATQAEQTETLDYIKTRVRKIWLKVKDEEDEE